MSCLTPEKSAEAAVKQIGTKNKYARKTRTGQHFERVFPLKTEIFCIKDKKEQGFPFNRFLIGGGKNHALFIMFFLRFLLL